MLEHMKYIMQTNMQDNNQSVFDQVKLVRDGIDVMLRAPSLL